MAQVGTKILYYVEWADKDVESHGWYEADLVDDLAILQFQQQMDLNDEALRKYRQQTTNRYLPDNDELPQNLNTGHIITTESIDEMINGWLTSMN
jgi:hypothetical protein